MAAMAATVVAEVEAAMEEVAAVEATGAEMVAAGVANQVSLNWGLMRA